MAISAFPAVNLRAPPDRDAQSISRDRGRLALNVLMDPPAEMEQNSNNPSNAGQSSPIKTGGEGSVSRSSNAQGTRGRTACSVAAHVFYRFGRDASEEIDVFVRVEFRHFVRGGPRRAQDVHFAVEAVVEDEIVRHFDSVRFHRVNCGNATR